jgi:hypothetical protein
MSNESFNPFEFLTTPWGKLPLGPNVLGTNGLNAADLKELDKRINELKAVEQWLSLNLNLLKTTIQGLEVQRGTLAAIQSFTESMSKPVSDKSTKQPESAASSARPPESLVIDQAAQWWESMQQQFGQMMQAAQAGAQSMAVQTAKPTKKSPSKSSKSDSDSSKSN